MCLCVRVTWIFLWCSRHFGSILFDFQCKLAVVDYILTPHVCFNRFTNFEIYPVRSFCEQNNLIPEIGDKFKLPDHSMLYCSYIESNYIMEKITLNSTVANCNKVLNVCQSNNVKYKFNETPATLLSGEHFMDLINATIERIESNNFNQTQVNDIYNDVCKLYKEAIDENVPKTKICRKKFKRTFKPWWNDMLKTLWESVVQAEKLYLKCTGSRQMKSYHREMFKQRQHEFDKCYSKQRRAFLRTQAHNINKLNTENPKQFWKEIKSLGPKKTRPNIPMEIENNLGIVTDENIVLDYWRKEFHRLYNKELDCTFNDNFFQEILLEKSTLENDLPYGNDQQLCLNSPITMEEVRKVICKAKKNKAMGCDNLPNEVFKNDDSIKLLTKLFNMCYEHHLIPEVWRKAIIKPIPKGNSSNPREPTSYRGISVLCCVYKLFSAVINNRLTYYLEQNELLADEQNGFRKARACIDHMFVLSSIVRNRKVKGEDTFVCFIDFKKAFDYIDRECLLYKLLKLGVNGKLYQSVKNIYSCTLNCVQLNNVFTDWFMSNSGVRQGDVLSTTLFNIYVNDLVLEINSLGCGINVNADTKLSCLLYADDIAIVSHNEEELQQMLDIVYNWCDKWRLVLNAEKTKIVHFRKQTVPRSNINLHFGENQLQYIEKYKYLGCIFNEFLDFTVTSNVLSDASGRALSSILNKLQHNQNLQLETFEKLYSSCVVPIMDYCAGVWGFKAYDKCNTIQNRAIRSFLGVHRFTSNVVINGDLGWKSPNLRHKICMIKLWNRFISMNENRLTKKVFINDLLINKKNWSKEIKFILQSCGYGDYFDRGLSCEHVMSNIEEQLFNLDKVKWCNDLDSQAKLRTYKLYKQ